MIVLKNGDDSAEIQLELAFQTARGSDLGVTARKR